MRTQTRQSKNKKRMISSDETKRILGIILIIIAMLILITILFKSCSGSALERLENTTIPDWVTVQLLDQNGASTNGQRLEDVNGIVVHYVGNAGSTAQANWNFFNRPDTKVNSHFLIGLEGEIIQNIPLNEMSAASNSRNVDTISIEVCHPDASGQFNDKSMGALIKLTAWLADVCGLGEDDLIRHYDITAKMCPLYYVENPDAWNQFRSDVMAAK